MSGDFLVLDLTAFEPLWQDSQGAHGSIWPSYCLPWFRGENPIVGEVAQHHRRATDFDAYMAEAFLDLDNRARRHWAEGWLELMKEPDTPQPINVSQDWVPPGQPGKVGVEFAQAVLAVCMQIKEVHAHSDQLKRLGLIVPGGLGSGPQEDLVNVLDDVFTGGVQLFPRPVAAALAWSKSPAANEILAAKQWQDGQYPGYLLATIVSADYWETDLVRLRIDIQDGVSLLCPVQNRTQHQSEFDVVGLATVAVREPADVEQHDRWRNWLLSDQQFRYVDMDQGHYQDACVALEIKTQDAESPNISPNSDDIVEEACKKQSVGQLLRHLHVGAQCNGAVPEQFSIDDRLPTPIFEDSACLLTGAAEGMKRIGENRVSYYEALAPLELKVDEENEFHDRIEQWKPLLDNAEVPAGEEYRTKFPIGGFTLPGGVQAIDLFIRTHRRGRYWYRKMVAQRHDQKEAEEPVTVSARMRPGRGQARVTVESVQRGNFYAELREQELEQVEKPVMKYAWPPGSAVVLSHPGLAERTGELMHRLIESAENGNYEHAPLEEMRRWLSKWEMPGQGINHLDPVQLNIPDGVRKEFVYAGVLSSGLDYGLHHSIEDVFPRFVGMIEDILNSQWGANDQWVLIKARAIAGWLYGRCPDSIRKQALEGLSQKGPSQHLEIAGKCFTSDSQISDFFGLLVWLIKNNRPVNINWWRAYRNLARLRPSALRTNVLSANDQLVIAKYYVGEFEDYVAKPNSGYFGEFCRLACHILKRRRFDSTFLEIGSPLHKRFRATLQNARRRAHGQRKEICKIALLFCDAEATPGTITQMGALDGDMETAR